MLKTFLNGIIKENPVFILALGLCPTLAVTSNATNALGMGLAVIFVLVCSNIIISLIRNFVPDEVRIPIFIVVIATFVTIVKLVMQAYFPRLYESLGLFVSLIVVNCIILGRAEGFAKKNTVVNSFFDGLGMGVGFTLALLIIGSIREILGSNKLFGLLVIPGFKPMNFFILAPGAFLVMGILMALIKYYMNKESK